MPTFTLAQRNADLDRHNAEVLAQIARDTFTDDRAEEGDRALSRLGDEVQLRGIPAIGRGVAGAMRGSRPGDNLR